MSGVTFVDKPDFSISSASYFVYLFSVKNLAVQCYSKELSFQDAEGLIVLNIGSYMGGVDLWQNDCEHDDNFSRQSMHDRKLEVVCVSGAWHLGKLQVLNYLQFSMQLMWCTFQLSSTR